MRKWAISVLLVSFLLISGCGGGSGGGGGSSVDGENVYYDGTIKVTTNGTTESGDTFDESTTITEFKIEHWNLIPGELWQGYDSGTGCNAEVNVDDWIGGPPQTHITTSGPKKVHCSTGLISFCIDKTDEGYKYSLYVSLPEPPLDNPIYPSLVMGMNGETLGDDFMPLEIHGEVTQSPYDGVTAKMTWVLNRHIKP